MRFERNRRNREERQIYAIKRRRRRGKWHTKRSSLKDTLEQLTAIAGWKSRKV